jgi:hypothetical protein
MSESIVREMRESVGALSQVSGVTPHVLSFDAELEDLQHKQGYCASFQMICERHGYGFTAPTLHLRFQGQDSLNLSGVPEKTSGRLCSRSFPSLIAFGLHVGSKG